MAAVDRETIEALPSDYAHAVLTHVGPDGYPVSVATDFRVEAGAVVLKPVAGGGLVPRAGETANVIFSHIRPQPGYGYDERRYVQLWGSVRPSTAGLGFEARRMQTWDEKKMPFFEYSERGVPRAHDYMRKLSEESGREVKPRLSRGWLFLRATRFPFLSATFVPVALGAAVAARHDSFSWVVALITFVGAAFIHLGLNVANDVFDTKSGADAANHNPTQFSGGSRVAIYGLMSVKQLSVMSAAFFLVGSLIGLWLAAFRGWGLLWIGLAGLFLAIFYTAPPLRLVHRGVGEIAVALGFGPVMLLGAYYAQTGQLSGEAWLASVPVAILIALVLYVNEIPDRRGDAAVGKRTLPVRLSKDAVIAGYVVAVAVAYLTILAGGIAGWLPRPALVALVTAPLAAKVARGMRAHYDSPYELMAYMGVGVNLHLFTGLLLIAGYVAAILIE